MFENVQKQLASVIIHKRPNLCFYLTSTGHANCDVGLKWKKKRKKSSFSVSVLSTGAVI